MSGWGLGLGLWKRNTISIRTLVLDVVFAVYDAMPIWLGIVSIVKGKIFFNVGA